MNTEEATTWATLLAGWTEFARSAVALPESGDGPRWKASIAPAIALHAVAMALPELIKLDPEERPLAMDRSEMLIREHAAALNEIWRAEPMPESLSELIDDARRAWEAALHEGCEWTVESDSFVAFHPADLAEKLLDAGFIGEVLVPAPGTTLFKGSVCATARERDGGPVDEEIRGIIQTWLKRAEGKCSKQPMISLPLRQVYRQFDFAKGGPVRDLLVPVVGADELPAGQPLLIPVVSGGAPGSIPPPRPAAKMTPIPVEELA
ncbi:MAG: hypothetical protein D6692_11220 [Planctomycetota bacterium]|nr:MAG: hypothetical protein D6692_11220 [Planctomycetota bacterium]